MITHPEFVAIRKTRSACSIVALILRIIIMAWSMMLLWSGGYPPAIGQTRQEKAQQYDDRNRDVELGKLGDFKTNQDNWNNETAHRIQELHDEIDAINAKVQGAIEWQQGGLAALVALSGLAIFFQLKRKE